MFEEVFLFRLWPSIIKQSGNFSGERFAEIESGMQNPRNASLASYVPFKII
jgi:hypothetical protein